MNNFLMILISIFSLATEKKLEFKVNGQNIEPETYFLRVGEVVEVNCNPKDPNHYASVEISLGSGKDISSGFKKGSATAKVTIASDSGGDSGYVAFRCHPSPDGKNLGSVEVGRIKTEIPGLQLGKKASVGSLRVTIDGKGVELKSYRLKVGDVLEVSCTPNDSNHYVRTYIAHGFGKEVSAGFQKGSASAKLTITSDSGGDNGKVAFGCLPSPDGKNLGSAEVGSLKTEKPGLQLGEVASIESLKIGVRTAPSAPAHDRKVTCKQPPCAAR